MTAGQRLANVLCDPAAPYDTPAWRRVSRVAGLPADTTGSDAAAGPGQRFARRARTGRDGVRRLRPGPTVLPIAEVYAAALRGARDGREAHWELRRPDGRATKVDVGRWLASPDADELELLRQLPAPVLDVGCGPGRHTLALLEQGVSCVGIDVLPAAVSLARERGAEVISGSVFGRLPARRWASAILLDGNIGIGANPVALLRRLRELLHARGELLVELDEHEPHVRTDLFELAGDDLRSTPFRWTVVGPAGIGPLAARTGFEVVKVPHRGTRSFACLVATPTR